MLSLAHAPTLVRRAFSWLRGFAVLMLRQYQAKACQKSVPGVLRVLERVVEGC